ncbi:AMP-binding protein [Aquimarina sp. TRL1]|uniref:AMP-binding protein n=1 Tax=Aquimarina sp. (strain TRL1) TaxID=2736252 RepID=UPI00158AF98E|nr:AMP-binding protein [Aquimarina sp. TRL1]QKX04989.1 AMP-binding protein [Aquimarina sp. TRL1]
MKSIIEILQYRAEDSPDTIAYNYIDLTGNITSITYGTLLTKTILYASYLKSKKIHKGDRCLLLFPQGISFIISFLACNWIGAIPIPLNIPGRNKPLFKWEKIASDANPVSIITTPSQKDFITTTLTPSSILSSLPVLAIKEDFLTKKNDSPSPDTIAFLQYTSGSTGAPKGVMVSQHALINNLKETKKLFSFSKESKMVSWLPFYHDMGLILGILQGLYSQCPVYLMSPADFMSHPLLWVEIITKYKGTHTAAPNFAYELIADKLSDKSRKNYSFASLERAVCGAEPIHLSTMVRFQEIAASYGLKDHVISPGYGLAEATLVVSSHTVSQPVKWLEVDKKLLLENTVSKINQGILNDTKESTLKKEDFSSYLVSNGHCIDNHTITIRDPETGILSPPQQIGEICFSGPSLPTGYWNNPKVTSTTFIREITTIPYIKTGDLGFLDSDNTLYVTGRIKDLIIIRGANYYPQDIERTAFSCNENLRTDGAAAFSILKEGQEKVILFQELTRSGIRTPDYKLWEQHIKQEIIRTHGIILESIFFIPPMHIPRTTSGKIQRSKAKSMYLNNEWKKIIHSYTRQPPLYTATDITSQAQLEQCITTLVAEQLGVSEQSLKYNTPFIELGITSMMSLLIKDTLENILDIPIPSTTLFNYNTIPLLSQHLYQLKEQTVTNHIPITTPEENYDHYSEQELLSLLEKELND